MTITIDLPEETAVRARAVAKARGLDLRSLGVALFEEAAAPAEASAPEPSAASKRLPWDEFAALMIEGIDPNQPPLPDYALRRESLYEDHY